MTEVNKARTILFRNLTKISHREYGKVVVELTQALNEDPNFVSRAMVHIFRTSQIRDLQDAAVITLLQANPEYPELRQAGRALFGLDFYQTENTEGLKSLEPYRLFRIWNYIRGYEIIEETVKNNGTSRKIQKTIKRKTPGSTTPRQLQTLMVDYFKFLEDNPTRFDGVVERNRAQLKSVYQTYHILLTDRAKQILYDDNPPPDSKLYWIKEIARTSNPTEAAVKAIESGVSYLTLASILPKDNVQSQIALINAMTPTEAANSVAWVEKSGLLNIPEVKVAFYDKLGKATKSAASLRERKSSQSTSEETQQIITKAADKAAAATEHKIETPTLVMVDISGSMEYAIEIAKKFLGRVAPLFSNPMEDCMVVLFRDVPQILKIRDFSMSGIEREMRLVRASGGTDMRKGYLAATQAGFEPSQVVLITDGGENRMGEFAQTIRHEADLGVVIIGLKPGMGPVQNYDTRFTQSIENVGIQVNEFMVENPEDYYIYDQVTALLGGEKGKSIVEQIMEIDLPYVTGKR